VQRGKVKQVIEALLFVHPLPLTFDSLYKILGDEVNREAIKEVLRELLAEYSQMGRSFHLVEVGGGYQFRTKAEYAT